MRQHGFIQLPIMTWAAIAAGVVILGLTVALKVQSSRLDSCQTKVEAQKLMIQGLGDQIKQQNAAIKTWEDAAKAAKAKGTKATAAAQQKVNGLQSEVNRLSGLLQGHQNQAKTCQDALADVRRGLVR